MNKDSDRAGTDRATLTAGGSTSFPAASGGSSIETSPISGSRSWVALLEELADRLVDAGFRTGKVLDAACGSGLLVAALRRRGVEAFGLDSSQEALAGVPEHIRRYCRAQKPTEPLDERYDLIVCINGLGRLPDGLQSAHLRSLTATSSAIFFAETADATDALARRVSVLEWMERFAGYAFAPSLTFSAPGFGDCAMLLRRGPAPAPEVMRLLAECMQLRAVAVRPSGASPIEVAREQDRARLLEGQLTREREYLETLRGTHAFLMQEVQKLRAQNPTSDAGSTPLDMDALLSRLREELAGGVGLAGQEDVWQIVQDQTDLRAQFTRLERRMTGNERSIQQVADRVEGILKSKIWRTLVSGAAVVMRFTGRGTRS